MWNTLQVFNLSHVHSRVKQEVHCCLADVFGSIGMCVPSKSDFSHWDFGLPVVYCLIVITLAWFYYIPAYTIVYASYNDRINGGIWGYGFLISVSIM